MIALDWPTLLAVATYFDGDPHEIERVLTLDEPDQPPEWCEWPVRGWQRRACARRWQAQFGGIRVCHQHEASVLTSLCYWIGNEAHARDGLALLEAFTARLRHLRAARDGELAWTDDDTLRIDEAMRRTLNEFLADDAAQLAREGLARVLGEAS